MMPLISRIDAFIFLGEGSTVKTPPKVPPVSILRRFHVPSMAHLNSGAVNAPATAPASSERTYAQFLIAHAIARAGPRRRQALLAVRLGLVPHSEEDTATIVLVGEVVAIGRRNRRSMGRGGNQQRLFPAAAETPRQSLGRFNRHSSTCRLATGVRPGGHTLTAGETELLLVSAARG